MFRDSGQCGLKGRDRKARPNTPTKGAATGGAGDEGDHRLPLHSQGRLEACDCRRHHVMMTSQPAHSRVSTRS